MKLGSKINCNSATSLQTGWEKKRAARSEKYKITEMLSLVHKTVPSYRYTMLFVLLRSSRNIIDPKEQLC